MGTTKEDILNSTIKQYENEIRWIENEIEMYESQLNKSKAPDFKSFCQDKIERLMCHIEDLEESIKELED